MFFINLEVCLLTQDSWLGAKVLMVPLIHNSDVEVAQCVRGNMPGF
jgi:hypothetical protein